MNFSEISIKSANLEDNKLFGKVLAKFLKPGMIICFYGEMGVGKTETVRSIITEACDDIKNVSSPTFNLMLNYKTKNGYNINHYDFFRINSPKEALTLNILESFYDSINLIEWPERIEDILPKNIYKLSLFFVNNNDNLRNLIFSGDRKIILKIKKKYEISI